MIKSVAIVGAGFSGTLLAINLLRHDGPRATLIERGGTPGRGLAYGTAHPDHVLNVRAENMSAFPDDPRHFLRWGEQSGLDTAPGSFVPRMIYGAYLTEMLEEARRTSPDRLDIVTADVTDVHEAAEGVSLRLGDGQTVLADAGVLAVGNLPPHDPPGLDPATLSPARYRGDPWSGGATDGLHDDDTILLIGSGLTMVDIALMLESKGFRGRTIALSRRGLLPNRHQPAQPSPDKLDERPATILSKLARDTRSRGQKIGWRNAIDELRPFTQSMWANATTAERNRFLRHLRPWWDVHRHRIAPQVADRIDGLRADGRLEIVAGKTIAFSEREDGVAVTWRPRGSDTTAELVAQRIVNCTGPQGNLAQVQDQLLRSLADRGTIRPDASNLGIDVGANAAVIDAGGRASDRLFATGPMTRGAFWEIVAVPDIRVQAWTLARLLSNAHWVGGEGL